MKGTYPGFTATLFNYTVIGDTINGRNINLDFHINGFDKVIS